MRDALVYAIRVLRALPGGGHKTQVGTWDFNDDWGYADEEQNNKQRLRPKASDITHMEVLLIGQGKAKGLINAKVLSYPEHRRTLIRWALWVANGCHSPDGEFETEQEFAWRIRMEEATMKRHRDFAASVMARQANEQEITVWASERQARKRRSRENLQSAGS
jgi:hypothetical protein